MITIVNNDGHGTSAAAHALSCHPAPKWVVIVNDQLFPMPNKLVRVAAIREQAGIPDGEALFRDHNSPNDVVLSPSGNVDLGEGNVLYSKPFCEAPPSEPCSEPAKLGLSVDDRWEIVVRQQQTGRTIRDLFALSEDVELLRDFKSPFDQVVGDTDSADFHAGPVFRTRHAKRFCVNIEGKEYPWPTSTITTVEIRKLGGLPADQPVVCEDSEGRERTLAENEVVHLAAGCRMGRAPKYKRG